MKATRYALGGLLLVVLIVPARVFAWDAAFSEQAFHDALTLAPKELRERLVPYQSHLGRTLLDREALGIQQAGGVVERLEHEVARAGKLLGGSDAYKTATVLTRVARLAIESTDGCGGDQDARSAIDQAVRAAARADEGYTVSCQAYPQPPASWGEWKEIPHRCSEATGSALYVAAVDRVLAAWAKAWEAGGMTFPALSAAVTLRPARPKEPDPADPLGGKSLGELAPGPREDIGFSTSTLPPAATTPADGAAEPATDGASDAAQPAAGEPGAGEPASAPTAAATGPRPTAVPRPAPTAESPAAEGTPAAAGTPAPTPFPTKPPKFGETDDQGRTEDYWRNLRKERQKAVDDARKAYEDAAAAEQSAHDRDRDQGYGYGAEDGSDISIGAAREAADSARQKMAEAKKALEDAERLLRNLAAECRAAGCIGAWVR